MRGSHRCAAFLMLLLAVVPLLAGCAACVPPPPVQVEAAPAAMPAPAPTETSRVLVSYFHRTIRCETCLKFEALTERALRDGFANELASGRLEWRIADFEEPGHESDVAKYDIFESSLIVSRFVGDEEMEWKKLDAIWDLVGDEGAFVQYIQFEVAEYLGGAAHGE
jgi:hypothetical protein